MGRVIEFRAWNKYHNKMYPVYMLNFESDLVYCKGKDYCGHTFGKIDCEIMQFTGLLDKNGVKIFEGDIIHLQWIHNYTGSVEFKNGTFCMVSAEKEIIVRALGELFAHNISVIGNIHQNPELLEKK